MAAVNIEDLNLDEITEETLLDEAIDMGTELGVDTRQGSVYRDAAMGHIARTAEFFDALEQVYDIFSVFTATGDVLDEYLTQRSMARNPAEATQAVYKCYFVGASPVIGALMIVDEEEFTVTAQDETDPTLWYITSVETGTDLNNFASGTAVLPDDDIDDLETCTLGDLYTPAVDVESDESARARLLEKISGPSENANVTQVKVWCEGVAGVGRARILPRHSGPNTVTAVIISTAGRAASATVVSAVQELIDPIASQGMGEGLATIGCFFTAVAASELAINVTANITVESGYTVSSATANFVTMLTAYLKNLALNSSSDEIVIRKTAIGSVLAGTEGVLDYDSLLINGAEDNVTCTNLQIPVTGEVTLSS